EGEAGFLLPGVVEAVADGDALVVGDGAARARVGGGGGAGALGGVGGEGHREAAGRVAVAEEDGGDGGAGTAARVPRLHDGLHVIEPGGGDGAVGAEDDDRAGVCGGDGGDELVLVAGQCVSVVVHALAGDPVHEDDGGVGRAGRRHGGGDEGLGLPAEGQAARSGFRGGVVVGDLHGDGASGGQFGGSLERVVVGAEEEAGHLAGAGDDRPAVDLQRGRPGRQQGEAVQAGGGRRQRAGPLGRPHLRQALDGGGGEVDGGVGAGRDRCAGAVGTGVVARRQAGRPGGGAQDGGGDRGEGEVTLGSLGVCDLDGASGAGADRVERGGPGPGVHVCGAGHAGEGVGPGRADDGERLHRAGERQGRGAVGEEHRGGDGRLVREVLVRLGADVVRGGGDGVVEEAVREHGDEDAPGRVVEPGGRYRAAGEGTRRDLDTAGAESGEVHAGPGGGDLVVPGPEVGHGVALEAHALLQVVEQTGVPCCERSVDLRVRHHYGGGGGGGDHAAEGRLVVLVERSVGHLGVDEEAVDFLGVGGEVLEGGRHVLGLDGHGEGGAQPSGEHRVLAHGFGLTAEVPGAGQVDGGA